MYSRAFRTSGGSAFCFSSTIWLIRAESCSAKNVSSRTIAPYLVLRDNRRRLPCFADAAGKRHPTFRQLGGGALLVRLDGRAAQDLSDPEKADCFFTESHRHGRLGQTERAGFGVRCGAGVPDNFRMRLQTNGQRRRSLREQAQNRFSFVFW